MPRSPQLWALSSEGLHFLPPQVRPSADSGFSLQAAPLFVTGGGRGDCGFTWSVGVWEEKTRSLVAPLSRPTLMLTKILPPQPARQG